MKAGFILFFLSLFYSATTAFSPESESVLVNEVLQHTNKFRRSKGLPALVLRRELNSIAQEHSNAMAKGRVGFGHSGFARRDAAARKKIRGIHSFAENVAYGPTTGREVVNRWKSSPGHRKNMLGRYRYIGIGIAKDRRGRIYYTQVFAG